MGKSFLDRDAEFLSPALARASDVVAVRGSGSYLYTEDGKAYLDLTSGIAVNQVGHSHPEVVQAIAEQAAKCMHTSCVVHYPANVDLAEKLAQIMPGNINNTFFSNSGAEAIDGSVKFAKAVKPGRNNLLVHKGGFHGRTLGATSLTSSKASYRKLYEPLLNGVHFIDFPNVYQAGTETKRKFVVEHIKDVMQRYLDNILAPETVAAMFIEPIQGEGGYLPAPGLDGTPNYLKYLREFCDAHGILLIFDEVQSGMGRTGTWFASEHYGVVPDVQTMAKGLSGGIPLGAFAANKELMYKMPPASHGSTFGGNPISCRAALKLIEIIERDKVLDNVKARSKQFFEFFESKFPGSDQRKPVSETAAKTNDPKFGYGFSAYHNPKVQVRGLGLMLAMVFPDAELVNKIKKYALEKQVLLLGCGPYANIIRLSPDLTISETDLQKGLDVIVEALSKS